MIATSQCNAGFGIHLVGLLWFSLLARGANSQGGGGSAPGATLAAVTAPILFSGSSNTHENVNGDVKNQNNNQNRNNEGGGLETGFIDRNGNKYEAATFNFCPHLCSCLDDYFECKKANLKQVPVLPNWVRSLDLTGNKLSDDDIVSSIANLTTLLSLNLKKNRLRRMPVFKGLLQLEKLNLAHNKIQIITKESLLSLPNLKELDLSKNAIKTILPNTFPSSNRLHSLNLNYNVITSLVNNSFDALRELNELQMNHNRMTNLPSGIFKTLGTLKKLDLSENKIAITWATFQGLNELRDLKLRSNDIVKLADGVFQPLKSITTIELDTNRIQILNKQGFYNLTTLTTLTLSNNSISRIEFDTWEFTQQLQLLDLSYNKLKELTRQHLEFLGKLQRLNLGHNNIHYIADGTFEVTRNLEQLNLKGNKLSWMIEDTSGPFKNLRKLIKLDISENNATSINQKAFIGLHSLQLLNLDLNNFTTIQFNAFEPLQQLQHLILNSEHFICDCNFQWFYKWISSTRFSGQITVICNYPLNLRGKKFSILKEDDFMCDESPAPKLIKEPINQLAIKGTNVTLECIAISSVPSDMIIKWKRDNGDINPGDMEKRTIMTSTNATMTTGYLHLMEVDHSHTGKYQCSASNNFGKAYSQKFKITVATNPGFNKVPSNITLTVGSTARLDCSAYGEPSPQIAWQKDGGNDFPAARERRMHVMPTDDAFFIINAKMSDMGVYTCTAENPAGIIKANATLTVQEAPTFVRPMRSKEVNMGQSSVLECMSSGSPKPTLRWYKDDKLLHLSERHFFAAEEQLLIIVDTKQSDAGLYKCEMENELGIVSGFLTLKVNKPILKSVVNVEEVTGIVIITVFCCAVGTSIIWVVIIYQTKRVIPGNGSNDYNSTILQQQQQQNSQNNNNNSNNRNSCNTNDIIGRNDNDNYLQVQVQDESRYRLIMPSSRSVYNSQIINLNSVGNSSNISTNIDGSNDGGDDEIDKISNSKNIISIDEQQQQNINSTIISETNEGSEDVCQIDSLDNKAVVIYRPNSIVNNGNSIKPLLCNTVNHRPPNYKIDSLTNETAKQLTVEQSTPLIQNGIVNDGENTGVVKNSIVPATGATQHRNPIAAD